MVCKSKAEAFATLSELTKPFSKATQSVEKFWNPHDSPIDIKRSNICAERAINVLQKIKTLCRSSEAHNLRFLLSN